MLDLKEERRKAGMTQKELADAVGVTRNHVCQIEKGKVKPSPAVAQRIGHALKFEWTRFFEGEQ